MVTVRTGMAFGALLLALCCPGCGSDKTTNGGRASITLQLVGSLDSLGAEDVVVVGDLAYLADQESVLVVVDVTDRAVPVRLGSVGVAGGGNGVALSVAGSYAYVAVEQHGVYIVDLTQPSHPAVVGEFAGAYAKDVAVVDTLAYVADQDYGLRIVDVSDPAAPVLVGSSPSDGPFAIAVAGEFAYCADNDSGLCIVDVSDPTAPIVAGAYRALESTRHVEVRGDYVFLEDYDAGPVIIEISNPAAPKLVAHIHERCRRLRLSGHFLFVAMGYPGGLAAYDIRSLRYPSMVDSCSTTAPTLGLDVDDGFVYVAAGAKFLIYSR